MHCEVYCDVQTYVQSKWIWLLINHCIISLVSIESVGSIEPQDLFVQAVQVLVDKCAQVKRALQATLHAE